MIKAKGRHELKHIINYSDVLQLRARLPVVARPDINGDNGNGYRVRSLYFDNYSDKALREKVDGVIEREKFRFRFYNGDSSFIRLEKKSKRNGMSFKESAIVTEEKCRRIINRDLSVLKESGNPLFMELYSKMNYQLLLPNNIVDYRREAYVYPVGNVRITIDNDIRSDHCVQNFLKPYAIAIPISDVYILEVKYDEFLPEIVRGMVALSSRRSAAYSKYVASRIIY